MDGAPLPCESSQEYLRYRLSEALVGIACDQLHARDTPVSRIFSKNPFQEPYDSLSTTAGPKMCLQPSASSAYCRDDSRGGDAAFPSALHVGGIELDVGHRKVFQGTFQ